MSRFMRDGHHNASTRRVMGNKLKTEKADSYTPPQVSEVPGLG